LGGLDWSPIGLWLAVVASGLYHGANPGMGWPLAVSAGLMERRPRALVNTVGWLAFGHGAAMLLVIAPFTLILVLLDWQRPIQIAASLLVAGFGLYLLVQSRHPRLLARIPPTRLALWSFLIALAHGAGFMLLPIYLGLCRTTDTDAGHAAAATLIESGLATAVLVASVHTLALMATSGGLAWLVYRYLGLKFLSRGWLNMDVVWALSLVGVGLLSLTVSLATSSSTT
jgi:hypothetical protein